MTVSVGTPIRRFDGNDVATEFPFHEIFYADTDLVVKHRANGVDTVLVLNTDYTVTGKGTATGKVDFPTGGSFGTLATGEVLSIRRQTPQERVADLVRAFFFDPMNLDMDKFVVMVQDIFFLVSRAAILTDPNSDAPITLEALMASLGDGSHSSLDGLDWLNSGHLDSFSGYTVSAAAPASTPTRAGQLWIRSTDSSIYISIGTSSPTDWKRINIKTFGFVLDGAGSPIPAGKYNFIPELHSKGTIFRVTSTSVVAGVKTGKVMDAQLLRNGANVSGSDPLSLNGTSEENKTSFSGWGLDHNAFDEPQMEVLASPVPTAEYVIITFHYIEK